MSFFAELKRRNVIRVGIAYVIIGWLIMQVGEVMAPALRLPDWVLSVLAFFIILGFPPAMFFAWAFELTPEGLKREKDVDRSQSITHVTGRKLNAAITVLLALALGYFAVDKFWIQPRTTTQTAATASSEGKEAVEHSIAVLPFADLSPEGDSEYFSDGLTEELLNILAKIGELRVAGRTSSFAFKGQNEDLRSIGEKLNVNTILEGSVRKDDKRNRVRITAQLINARDGYHLWSETYDRDLDDIFAIQEEIAGEVAHALRIKLLGEDEARLQQVASTGVDAYELYLKGLQGIHEGGFESLDQAVGLFQQALSLDPNYVPAKVGLVTAWNSLARTGAITRQEAIQRGVPMLQSVLAEQPGRADAHVQMAVLRMMQFDGQAAEREFTAALEAEPRNAAALSHYGRFLFDLGQVERGLDLIQAALEIEPYDVRNVWNQCQTNAYLQRVDTALAACKRVLELAPDGPLGYYGLSLVYTYNGDLPKAIQALMQASERDPEDYEMLAGIGAGWTGLGDPDRANQWLQRAEAIGAGQPVPTFSRVLYYQFREQHGLARELAERALAQNLEDRFGSNSFLRNALAFEAVLAGDLDAAIGPYRQAFPWAFESPIQIPADPVITTQDLIELAALIKLREPLSTRAEELLQLAESRLDDRTPAIGIWERPLNRAAIAVVRGDDEGAIKHLNEAWDMNWRTYWRSTLVNSAVFYPLRNKPGYRELLARFEADMERQRQATYELLGVSNG